MSKAKVVLTGGTGYLGSQILKVLLEKDYHVHLTSRNVEKTKELSWIKELEKKKKGEITFFSGDLTKEGSFDEAMKGAKYLIHAASPFKIDKIKDAKKELVDPAVNGTKYALDAATKSGSIEKVVLTSSLAAIYGDAVDKEEIEEDIFTEEHWNTSSSISHQPYSYSKVSAELKAWKLSEGKSWKLVTINPGFIIGPSITKRTDSTSISFVLDMLRGKFKMGVPDLYFAVVDVRDVALAHVIAMENQKAEGRHICSNTTMSALDMANTLRQEVGDKYGEKLPKKNLPKWLTYLFAPILAGFSWNYLRKNLGIAIHFDNLKIKKMLGINFRPINTTFKDHVLQLEKDKLV